MSVNNKIIKLFVTDIDGVWTDGGMYYAENGDEMKKFNTYDSAGVLLLSTISIPTAIITGENTKIVKRRAEKLNVPYLFQGVDNKLLVANQICKEIGIRLENIAFIGDDLNDMKLLEAAGISACPSSSPNYIQKKVDWVLPVAGGCGAFRGFVEKYLEENNLLEKVLIKLSQEKKYG